MQLLDLLHSLDMLETSVLTEILKNQSVLSKRHAIKLILL